MMNATIERLRSASQTQRLHERLDVKAFRDREAMFKFLATGDNALRWKESARGFKAGTYAFAGGKWHNVKSLDATLLAHI